MEVVRFDEQGVRDDDRDRARLAGHRQRERLPDRRGDLADVLDVEDALGHRLEQGDLVEAVDLEGPELLAVGDVADDGDERHGVEQRLADAGERVGDAGAGHDASTPGLPVARA